MKSADIKIGERYKVGYYGCGEVLETRVERTGRWGTSSRKDGVRVKFESGYREGEEMIVSSREVEMLWDEHQSAVDARDLQRKIAEQDRGRLEEKVERADQALRALGIETAVAQVSYAWGNQNENYRAELELSEESLDRLMEVLAAPEASDRASKIESEDPLAELLV